MKYWLCIILVCVLAGCKQLRPLLQKTARGKYESSFSKKDSLFMVWKQAHQRAMQQPLLIELPLVLSVKAAHPEASALVYTAGIRQGEMLVAEIQKPDSVSFFVEFFAPAQINVDDDLRAELKEKENRVTWIAKEADSLRISVQPALNDSATYEVKIYKQPAFLFPVAGRGNNAMQSFWGAARDGGGRSHEGIDIFAPRGTPVVAVGDGRLGFTGERGIGGKQVWLYENQTGYSIYYAHLDSIKAETSGAVSAGDTLGFVGNTGNAAGGATHLHFGIYGGGGAIDPLHFIKRQSIPEDKKFSIKEPVITSKGEPLRSGPGSKYPTVIQLQKNEKLKVQARSGNWLHVLARDSLSGFIPQ